MFIQIPAVSFQKSLALSALKLANLVDKKVEFLHLNICYMLCVLLNKILANVIWKSFSFRFIQI